jgi:hypothetical protein
LGSSSGSSMFTDGCHCPHSHGFAGAGLHPAERRLHEMRHVRQVCEQQRAYAFREGVLLTQRQLERIPLQRCRQSLLYVHRDVRLAAFDLPDILQTELRQSPKLRLTPAMQLTLPLQRQSESQAEADRFRCWCVIANLVLKYRCLPKPERRPLTLPHRPRGAAVRSADRRGGDRGARIGQAFRAGASAKEPCLAVAERPASRRGAHDRQGEGSADDLRAQSSVGSSRFDDCARRNLPTISTHLANLGV